MNFLNIIRYGLYGKTGDESSRSKRSVLWLSLVIGALYSIYYVLLAAGDHQPSSTRWLFVPPSQFYWAASAYITPLIPVLTYIATETSRRIMGGNKGHGSGVHWAQLGPAYLAPLLVFYLIPEVIIYTVFGFDSLAASIRILGALFAFTVFVRFIQILARLYPGQRIRIIIATLLAALAQSLPAVILIR